VRLITDGSSEWNQHLRDDDLERALLLLYHRLSRTWNSNDHLKDLKQLFPRVVGCAPFPSALERLVYFFFCLIYLNLLTKARLVYKTLFYVILMDF